MIEVILKQDVEHLGHRGDIVKVAPGYARNYLLPRRLALAAQGLEVDRRRIQLTDPIKRVGEHSVGIRLHRDVVAQVLVHVVKEGQ